MRKLVFASFAIMALLTACKEEKTLKTVPERQGARGEGCIITNDCKSGLLCVGARCIDEDFGLKASSKSCVEAQCVDSTDCCPDKSKPALAECATLKSNCDEDTADGFDRGFCDQYDLQCGKCKATCTNHTCVLPPPDDVPVGNCTDDSMCAAQGEVCVNGFCAECGKDSDCGKGFYCEGSMCQRDCIRDQECPALHACSDSGRCEKRDCKTDRECVALTGSPDAVCAKSGKCSIPCDSDAGCASLGGLYSCAEGFCTTIGCETDAECAMEPNIGFGALMLCLEKAEADKIGL